MQVKQSASELLQQFEVELSDQFKRIDEMSLHNHKKVAQAFAKVKVSSEHFNPTSGYGHDDLGREKFDELFAAVFNAEAALARVNIVSGTHAIACAILGNLKANDEIVFALDEPYDTLTSLLNHLQSNLNCKVKIVKHKNWDNFETVINQCVHEISENTKLVSIQRSRGYSATRPSVNITQIAQLIGAIKHKNPQAICFVDNCYGEFVEKHEPIDVGADLMAGSLIKNPGGGIVLTGGYVVGRKDLVEAAAERLTCPGVGAEGGPSFNQGRLLFQGLYMAPLQVSQALKGMLMSARVCEHLGFQTSPRYDEERTDTIQRLDLGDRERLIEFCKTLQQNSPVDSHLTPQAAQTPGYNDELIMAAGTFIEGSTSELSADGPLREPFSAYIQGGLSYFYTRIFLEKLIGKYGS